jgi:hypothetical protein
MLKIGYAQKEISPTLDHIIYLAGFGQNRVATRIHDPLYVRVLALEFDQTILGMVALDLLGLFRPFWQKMAEHVRSSFPQAALFGACTHTHHGPDTMGLWGPNRFSTGVNKKVLEHILSETQLTAMAAFTHLTPAQYRASAIPVLGIAKNARNPEILDTELSCVQFADSSNGSLLATIVVFPCHPEVLWDNNLEITSDYPAYLRQEIELATNAPCLFFPGALGGMMTPDIRSHTFDEAERIGKTLAHSALKTIAKATFQQPAEVEFRRKEFDIPMTNVLFRVAKWMGLLPKNIDRSGVLTTEINLLTLGATQIVGVPGELLPKLGLEIKSMLNQRGAEVSIVIGLANDEIGYIIPEKDYIYPRNPLNPGDHYEETMAVGPQAGPLLMEALRELLDE